MEGGYSQNVPVGALERLHMDCGTESIDCLGPASGPSPLTDAPREYCSPVPRVGVAAGLISKQPGGQAPGDGNVVVYLEPKQTRVTNRHECAEHGPLLSSSHSYVIGAHVDLNQLRAKHRKFRDLSGALEGA